MYWHYIITLCLLFSTTSSYSAAEAESIISYHWYTTEAQVATAIDPLFKPFIPSQSASTFAADGMNSCERALIEMNLNKGFEALVPVAIHHVWNQGGITDSFLPQEAASRDGEEMLAETKKHLETFYSLDSYSEKKAFMEKLKINSAPSNNFFTRFFISLWHAADTVKNIFEKEAYYRQKARAEEAAITEHISAQLITVAPTDYSMIPHDQRPRGYLTGLYTTPALFPQLPDDGMCFEFAQFLRCSFEEKMRALGWYITGPDNLQLGVGWAGNNKTSFLSFGQPEVTCRMQTQVPAPLFADPYGPAHIASREIAQAYIEIYQHEFNQCIAQDVSFEEAQHRALSSASHNAAFLFTLPLDYSSTPLLVSSIRAKSTPFTPEVHTIIMDDTKTIDEKIANLTELCRETWLTHQKGGIIESFIGMLQYLLILEEDITGRSNYLLPRSTFVEARSGIPSQESSLERYAS